VAKTHGSATHYVAPTVRAAFLRALDLIEAEKGLTFSELIKAEIEKNGLLAVMDRVGKYMERTSSVDMNHSGEIGLVGILESLAGRTRPDTEMEAEPGSVRH